MRLCSPKVAPPPPRAQKCSLFGLRCDHPCLFVFSRCLLPCPAAAGCSHYSTTRLQDCGEITGERFPFLRNHHEAGGRGAEGGGVCHSCRPGLRDTNDVNLFVLVGDVYNFEACIYQKNSLPSTSLPPTAVISVTKYKLTQQIINKATILWVSVLQFIVFTLNTPPF